MNLLPSITVYLKYCLLAICAFSKSIFCAAKESSAVFAANGKWYAYQ